MAASNYDALYANIQRSEGGLSTRNAASGDPGGRTMRGVTQGTYNAYRQGEGLSAQDVARISDAEHSAIFRNQYWNPIRGDDLPTGLDYAVMDTAINAGPSRAIRLLQRTLGLAEDGVMGPDTIAALGDTNPAELLGRYTANRRAFQLNLANADQNPGWGPRINRVNEEAAAAIRNGGFGGNTLQPPAIGSDYFGSAADVSSDVAPGTLRNPGGLFESGNPFAFGGNLLAGGGGVAPGSFGTGITPFQPAPSRFAFSGQNVSGGAGNGSLNPALSPFQPAPGAYDFAGQNVSGGIAAGNLNGGVSPYQAAPGQYAFGSNVSGGIGNGSMAGFDAAAYLAANPDVARAGINPLEHYRLFGINEGRPLSPGAAATGIPAPPATPAVQNLGMTPTVGPGQAIGSLQGFDSASYLAANPDVAASGIPALTHYQMFGIREGRPLAPGQVGTAPAPGLTPTLASQQVGTIGAGNAVQGLNPTQARTIGAPAAVGSIPGFDAASYLAANPDVAASGIPAETHYQIFGIREGRPLAPGQASTIPASTAPTIGPPATTQAWSPGRSQGLSAMASVNAPTIGPSSSIPGFDAAAYLAANPDVAASGIPAETHYQVFGIREGRPLHPGEARTIPAPAATPTLGNYGSAQTIGAPGLTPTIGAPGLTPTYGAPDLTPTISAPPAVQAYDPGTVSNFGFSSANVGTGLGATPQSFGSFYSGNLLGGGGGRSQGIGPYGFSGANVSGFNPNSMGVPTSSTPYDAVSGGVPFGGSSIIGGIGGAVRSDGTTAGSKSLAQTNAEFAATTPNYFARENTQDTIRNANMASFGNSSLQASPITTPMGYNGGHVMAPTPALPAANIGAIPLASGAFFQPLAFTSFAR